MALSKKEQAALIRLFKQSFKCEDLKSVSVDDQTQQVNVTAGRVVMRVKGHIPVKLGVVIGGFDCSNCELQNLNNGPHTITESFSCSNNNLTTLQDGPLHVGSKDQYIYIYSCGDNPLINFKGMPSDFTGRVIANYSSNHGLPQLQSVDGIPATCRNLELSYSPTLPMLKLLELNLITIYDHGFKVHPITYILTQYKGQGKAGAIKAAVEMIRAGYKENARW